MCNLYFQSVDGLGACWSYHANIRHSDERRGKLTIEGFYYDRKVSLKLL